MSKTTFFTLLLFPSNQKEKCIFFNLAQQFAENIIKLFSEMAETVLNKYYTVIS